VDPAARVLAWRRTDEDAGHSMARVERSEGGWTFHGSEVLAGPGAVLSCGFRVDLDDAWSTRRVEVWSVAAPGERRLVLTADAEKRWWRDNTFPINRLASLAVGASATSPVAWVEVPSLRVARVEQTYRRLAERRWEYSDEAHGAFELSVDGDGLVVEYSGFATRVAP
jgi:hypothetical protein